MLARVPATVKSLIAQCLTVGEHYHLAQANKEWDAIVFRGHHSFAKNVVLRLTENEPKTLACMRPTSLVIVSRFYYPRVITHMDSLRSLTLPILLKSCVFAIHLPLLHQLTFCLPEEQKGHWISSNYQPKLHLPFCFPSLKEYTTYELDSIWMAWVHRMSLTHLSIQRWVDSESYLTYFPSSLESFSCRNELNRDQLQALARLSNLHTVRCRTINNLTQPPLLDSEIQLPRLHTLECTGEFLPWSFQCVNAPRLQRLSLGSSESTQLLHVDWKRFPLLDHFACDVRWVASYHYLLLIERLPKTIRSLRTTGLCPTLIDISINDTNPLNLLTDYEPPSSVWFPCPFPNVHTLTLRPDHLRYVSSFFFPSVKRLTYQYNNINAATCIGSLKTLEYLSLEYLAINSVGLRDEKLIDHLHAIFPMPHLRELSVTFLNRKPKDDFISNVSVLLRQHKMGNCHLSIE